MTHSKIIFSCDNLIARITLNYPEKHNVLNSEIIDSLTQLYDDCEKNAAVKIIILTAHGKHFCAGADLQQMLDMGNAAYDINLTDAKKLAALFYRIYSCAKPTIACVFGKIRGGGIGLVAAQDCVIAARNTTFCFTEVTLGLAPAVISPFVLQRMSFQKTKYAMQTAEIFDAQKALELQLIDQISDENTLTEIAFSHAAALCKNNLPAMQQTKKMLQSYNPITQEKMNDCAALLATLRSAPETKKLIQQFLTAI